MIMHFQFTNHVLHVHIEETKAERIIRTVNQLCQQLLKPKRRKNHFFNKVLSSMREIQENTDSSFFSPFSMIYI